MFAILPITHTNTSCNKEHWLQYGYHNINDMSIINGAPTLQKPTLLQLNLIGYNSMTATLSPLV